MRLNVVLAELQEVRNQYGNINVQLQNSPERGEMIMCDEVFFVVPEPYHNDDGTVEIICNIRAWPY